MLNLLPYSQLLNLRANMVHHVFTTWGPSARNCMRISGAPTKEANYEGLVKSAALTFVMSDHSTTEFNAFKVSHRLFSVGPEDDSEKGRQVMVAVFASKRVETIIAHAVANARAEERLKFYDMISRHTWLRSPVGHLFEIVVLTWLSARSGVPPLTCHPAIKTGPAIDIPAPGNDATIFFGSSTGSKNEVRKMVTKKEILCLLPLRANFTTADAIVITPQYIITIQVTIADKHSAKGHGFDEIKDYVPLSIINARKWCHVFVTDNKKSAKSLRKPLPQFPNIGIYSAIFNYGRAKDDNSETNIGFDDMKAFDERRVCEHWLHAIWYLFRITSNTRKKRKVPKKPKKQSLQRKESMATWARVDDTQKSQEDEMNVDEAITEGN